MWEGHSLRLTPASRWILRAGHTWKRSIQVSPKTALPSGRTAGVPPSGWRTVDTNRPDLLKRACCCTAPMESREVGKGRKDVRWVARPGRSVAEPRVGAVLTQSWARTRRLRAPCQRGPWDRRGLWTWWSSPVEPTLWVAAPRRDRLVRSYVPCYEWNPCWAGVSPFWRCAVLATSGSVGSGRRWVRRRGVGWGWGRAPAKS